MVDRENPRLGYVPALDGIRAIAVGMVLCFHGGFAWMTGGFLGVSTFFTLSGFLITGLLLAEHRRDGTINLRRFWGRRYRRLLPASFAGLGLVLVLVATGALPTSPELPGDVLAALAQVANWRFLFEGTSYAQLFAAPSPVLHYWSLAIEEQHYLAFPPLVWFVLRHRARALAPVLGALALASTACAVALGLAGKVDATYYATPARLAELLTGSLLALALAPGRRALSATASKRVATLGMAALAVTIGLGVVTTIDDRWLQLGGLPAFSLVSVALVAGALQPGPLAAALALRPLVWVGRASYGIYVFHWPIFLWLDAERTGLDRWPLFGLRLAVTMAIAVPSLLLLERPVRLGRLRNWAPIGAVAAAAVVVIGAAAIPTSGGSSSVVDFAAARRQLAALQAEAESGEAGTTGAPGASGGPAAGPVDGSDRSTSTITVASGSSPATTVAGTSVASATPRKLRVAAFGDSTGLMTALGVGGWGNQDGRLVLNADGTQLGCGIGRDGRRRYGPFPAETIPDHCRTWPERFTELVQSLRADVALIQAGPFDVTDRQLPGDPTWRAPGDPIYDAYLKEQILAMTDLFAGQGVQVVWLTNPHIELGANDGVKPAKPYPVNDPARMDRLNQLIAEVAAERPATTVIDLAGHLRSLPGGEMDRRLRPDGVHFTLTSTPEIGAWLGPALLDAMAGRVDLTRPPRLPAAPDDRPASRTATG